MLNGIQDVTQRIKQIRSLGSAQGQSFKPDRVTDFENQLSQAVSQTNNKEKSSESSAYHPFLTNKIEENIEVKTNVTLPIEKTESLTSQALIQKTVSEASAKYDVPEALIYSVIRQESAFDQFAVSRAGAMGLMQLMPKTALELGVEKPFDVTENINGGVKYLKQMLDRFDGDVSLALAAYNAGPDRVEKSNGIPKIQETEDYVKKITEMLQKTLF